MQKETANAVIVKAVTTLHTSLALLVLFTPTAPTKPLSYYNNNSFSWLSSNSTKLFILLGDCVKKKMSLALHIR